MAKGSIGSLEIQIAANVAQLQQDVNKVEREMNKMRQTGQKTAKSLDSAASSIKGFQKLAVGVGAAIVAIRALGNVMSSSMEAYGAQQDAEKKLETAIGGVNKGLLDQAAALQKVSKFGDETIIEAQALIGAFIKDENQIKLATKATLDLAAAKGMDLKAAADLMSKSLGSSTNALSRYGIQVEGAVGSNERLQSAVQNISNLFGGQAAAQATTMEGRIQQMKNAYGDLQEQLIKNLAPAITSMAQKLTQFFEAAQKWGDTLKNVWAALADDIRVGNQVIEDSSALSGLISSWKMGAKIIADDWLTGMGVIQRGIEETAERGKKILEEKAQKETAPVVTSDKAAQAAADAERIKRLQTIIAAEQKLWQEELDLIALNDAAEASIAKRAADRKEKELALDKQLLDQKMNMTQEIVRAANTAEAAGLASFKTAKKIGAAMALVNAYLAISNVWAEKSNSVYETVAKVAYTAGQVFSVVAALRNVNVGGGGGAPTAPGAPPATGGQSLLSQDAQNVNLLGGGGQTTIVFQGGTFIGGDKDALARDLTPAIEQALSDGASGRS